MQISAKQKYYETTGFDDNQNIEINTIEVEAYKIAPKKRNKKVLWIKNSIYQLISVKRDILRSESKWLTDNIIFASQNILKVKSWD